MKKRVSLFITVVTLLAILVTSLALTGFAAASYTEISSVSELKAMKSTGNYRLTEDLTLSDGTTLAAFSGNFDGNGHAIKGLTAPLFASLAGSVSDLTLEGSITASGSASVGALAKSASGDLTVKGVTVNVTVKAASATGVAGFIGSVAFSKAGTVSFESCVNLGDISGRANVGGFVGQVSNSSSSYSTVKTLLCINEGDITMTSQDANIGVAGIVAFGGRYSDVNCEKTANYGNITSAGGDNGVAGIYGGGTWASGDAQKFTARYCANRGDITVPSGRGRAAGICGRMNRHGLVYTLEYCYNTGTVSARDDSAAGIFSYTNASASMTVRYCYNAGELKNASRIFPVAGSGSVSTAVIKGNYYVGTDTNYAGENIEATKLDSKDALNGMLLTMDGSPYAVASSVNGGYAFFIWECGHGDILDSCVNKMCKICETVLEEKNGSHSFGEWIIDSGATATEDGSKHRSCKNCPVVETVIIPATTSVTPVNGVYAVKNSAELIWIFNGMMSGSVPANANIKLTVDIDVKGALPMMTATFTGTLDGNGKTVSGISATLFKQFNGSVSNLTLKGEIDASKLSDKDTARKAASFALSCEGASFTKLVSYVNIKVERNDLNAGGLVGYAKTNNSFVGCAYHGDYTVNWTGDGAGIGGLVGWSNANGGSTTFDDCHFGGKITVSGGVANGEAYIGGILGNCTNATVSLTRCTSEGTVTSAITSGKDYVGGIVGIVKTSSASVTSSASKSVLTAVNYAGGIVGGATESIKLNLASVYGKVEGSTAGIFCGVISSGKNLTFTACADFLGGLKNCGSGSSTNVHSHAFKNIVDLNKTFTHDGVEYKRYNLCLTEKESGILVETLSTTKKFTPYISLRDDGTTHSVRFVVLTDRNVANDSVTVSIVFKDSTGKTVKTLTKKLAVTDSDFTLYSAVNAGGVNYFAAGSQALFGLVIKDIPMGAWERVEMKITDTKDGTVYMDTSSFDLSTMPLTHDQLPDYSHLGNVSAIYNCGPGMMNDKTKTTIEDSFMTVISGTTAEKLASYVATLEGKGYEFIGKNVVDGDTYYTYRKFGSLLYLYHNKCLGETRIICDNSSDLLSEINYEYEKKAGDTVEFYQYSLNYAFADRQGYDPVVYTESGNINCGMCYIFKLPDNKVIIVDSGHETQSTAASRAGLVDFLKKITGTKDGEKVEIAMWFFTHAHGDHVRMAADIVAEYHDQISIESVTHNFPSYQVLSGGYDANTFTLKDNLNKYFPDVTYHKLHTGEVLSLAGLTMEVVFTHEDLVNASGKSRVSDFNSTSTVLKINFEGKTIMLLGDLADDAEGAFIALHNPEYFKSDVVQIAHHGFNYLSSLYPLIDAPIAIFPQSMFNMKDPGNSQGNLAKYKGFMKYSTEEYFAHKYTYKFTVVNGEIVAEALPRYDAK